MVIRGAPAIGVAAAMGLALGVRKSTATGTQSADGRVLQACATPMAGTRPTAVNLFWAIDRMKRVVRRRLAEAGASVADIRSGWTTEARTHP